MHTFNSNAQEAEGSDLCEFESSLVFIQSSRKARATNRDSILKRKKEIPIYHTHTLLMVLF